MFSFSPICSEFTQCQCLLTSGQDVLRPAARTLLPDILELAESEVKDTFQYSMSKIILVEDTNITEL